MRVPTTRPRQRAGLLALPLGILLAGLLVTGSSYSVFSATTSNSTNQWTAGSVALTSDGTSTAMFTVQGMKPGDSNSRCIAVTSNGTVPSTVKLYGTGYNTTNALGQYVTLVITQGTGGSFAGGCSGFTPLGSNSSVFSGSVETLGAVRTSFATGTPTTGAWTPAGTGSETRVYKVDWTFSSSAPASTQGGTAALGFTWEAQSN